MNATETRHAVATTRMIQRLPKGGALVVVHAHAAIGPIRALIAAKRGASVAAAMRVVAAPSERDELAIAAGTSLPVFREPFVAAQRAHARAIHVPPAPVARAARHGYGL